MRNLEQYEIDELVVLLQEFLYRTEEEPELQGEIESMLGLLEQEERGSNDE